MYFNETLHGDSLADPHHVCLFSGHRVKAQDQYHFAQSLPENFNREVVLS